MNRSLFNLISRAGRVSLDELRARSSVEQSALPRELVAMVRDGIIALSRNPDANDDQIVIAGDPEATNFLQDFLMTADWKVPAESVYSFFHKDDFYTSKLTDALDGALQNEKTASALMVSPTARGFKITS